MLSSQMATTCQPCGPDEGPRANGTRSDVSKIEEFQMRKTLSSLALIGALVAATPLLAADDKAAIPANTFYKGQQADQYLARDLLITAKVHAADGKIIGDIEDLILNTENRVEGVIMGVGGFLSVGEKRVGVRLSALKISEKDGKPYIELPGATKEVLKALDAYQRAKPAKSMWDRAMEKAQELHDKTLDSSQDAYQHAKEQAGPAYEKAKKDAQAAYEKAKQASKEAYDKAKKEAEEAYDKAKGAAQKPAEAPKQ